jgi:hypothetical protein
MRLNSICTKVTKKYNQSTTMIQTACFCRTQKEPSWFRMRSSIKSHQMEVNKRKRKRKRKKKETNHRHTKYTETIKIFSLFSNYSGLQLFKNIFKYILLLGLVQRMRKSIKSHQMFTRKKETNHKTHLNTRNNKNLFYIHKLLGLQLFKNIFKYILFLGLAQQIVEKVNGNFQRDIFLNI